jgi:hypothetical protein
MQLTEIHPYANAEQNAFCMYLSGIETTFHNSVP